MSEKQIQVPSEMLSAAWRAVAAKMKEYTDTGREENVPELHVARIAVEEALRWQKTNAPSPNTQQCYELRNLAIAINRNYNATEPTAACCHAVAVDWVGRMYDATQPEHKDGTVLWKAGTTIPVGVWANGKLYTTSEKDYPKVPEKIKDLLLPDIESGFFKPEVVNERMAESFSRGYDEGYSQGHSDRSRDTFG